MTRPNPFCHVLAATGFILAAGSPIPADAIPMRTFDGGQGRYEMCLKYFIHDLRTKQELELEPSAEMDRARAACRKNVPNDAAAVVDRILLCGVDPEEAEGKPDCRF